MSYRTEESEIIVVKFSQAEGQQLFALLEHSIAQADQRLALDAIVGAIDSLSDANALARWQRENVALELRPEEAAAVLQALELGPECCKRCAATATALQAASEDLRGRLASRHFMVGQMAPLPTITLIGSSCIAEPLAAVHC